MVNAVINDIGPDIFDKFVYITAKTLWVTPENPGNRPGWHSDGFLTNDLNYIWYDSNPTLFFDGEGQLYDFTEDHVISLGEMTNECEMGSVVTYPLKTLLKLDQTVLHKVDDSSIIPGMRTFIKISVSDDLYALKGNSVNHALNLDLSYQERTEDRNCPIGGNTNG